MKGLHAIIGTVTIGLIVSSLAIAQGTLTEKNISVSMASDAALAAIEQCRKDGYRVAVAVLDRAGNVKALLRDDGAGPHTTDSARRKAFTSASFRISTAQFGQNAVNNPGLTLIEGTITLAGGLPIASGNEVIGGIGVGGAPSGAADAVCAQAGIDKIKDRL